MSPRNVLSHVSVAAIAVLAFAMWSKLAGSNNDEYEIIVSGQMQQDLARAFQGSWQRQPSRDEFASLVDNFVHEEMAVRTALRLSLGSDDVVVRRRLQEKLEAQAAEQVLDMQPSRQQLQSFLDDHADDFRVDGLLSFRQVYFSSDGNDIGADAAARFMLGELRRQDMPDDLSQYGDGSPLPVYVENLATKDIVATFGTQFATQLAVLSPGQWHGPVRSDHGIHLVHVDDRNEGRVATLGEVEDSVRRAWRSAQRENAIADLYRQLDEQYTVTLEAERPD